MPRRLRLARRDAETRAPTSALTSVDLPTFGRPTMATWPQRNAAAARIRHRSPARRRAAAAACSAARRLGPAPVAAISSAGIRQTTSNVCTCASPRTAATVIFGHRQLACPAAIPAGASSDPCRDRCGSRPRSRRRKGGRSRRRAASKPPSRKIAPNTASSASARIDGRDAPPLFNSPSPSRIAAAQIERAAPAGTACPC